MEKKNYNGFVSEKQYDDVRNAIMKSSFNFNYYESIDIKYDGLDYVTVNADGLEFDIDFTDETITNITCDFPMGMYEIELINDVYKNVDKIYEAGRACFEEEEVNA